MFFVAMGGDRCPPGTTLAIPARILHLQGMADEPEILVLQLLRSIRADMDIMKGDLRDIKVRTTGVEEAVVGVNRRLARLETRVERIEKRLDLVEA